MDLDIKKWIEKDGVEFLKNIGIDEGNVVLDFGCGSGALIKHLREHGIEAFGIEIRRQEIIDSLSHEVKPYFSCGIFGPSFFYCPPQ